MTLSDVREYFSELISENGFDALYQEDACKKAASVMADASIWNPLKHWLRSQAKKSPDASAAYIDDWVSTLHQDAGEVASGGLSFSVGDHVEVADALAQRVEAHGEVVYDLNGFYQYRNDAVWERLREQDFTRVLASFSGAPVHSGKFPVPLKVSSGMIDGVLRVFRDHVDQSAGHDSPGFFDSAPPGIMFSDAFLRVDLSANKIMLEEPSPAHRQPIHAGCDFDGPMETPIFDAYTESIFRGDTDADKKVELMLEFAGACLANIGAKMQRALLLYDATERSTGANGKSVFIKILDEIFPPSASSSISPVEFSEKFTRAMLQGRRINFVTEMPDEHGVISGETTKAILTGEPIKAEHKNQPPFFFSPTAGHVFACNEFPSVSDNSEAFWRRWMVVPFNRTFGPGESDPDLVSKIVEKERDALLRRIALALGNLVRRGGYDVPDECEQAFSVWKRESDSVLQFLCEDSCNYRNGGYIEAVDDPSDYWVSAGELYKRYRDWASFWGLRGYGKNKFGRRCTKLLDKKRTSSGQEYRITLKTRKYGLSGTVKVDSDPF